MENAAIGATGSDLAVFRAERDILQRDCDLVFVEYAVNDLSLPDTLAQRSREGLLRKLLACPTLDVVLVYTHSGTFFEALQRGGVPDSIARFEALAEHYQIPSVWAGRYAWEQVESGRAYYDKWLPDGLDRKSVV